MNYSMSRLVSICILLLFTSLACGAEREYATVTLDSGKTLDICFVLPDDFDSERTYPVILAPGSGKKGGDVSYFLKSEDIGKHDWIIVESLAFFSDDPLHATRALAQHVRQKCNVESDRFFTIGYSANSGPMFQVVLALPELFRGVIAVPGHPRTASTEQLNTLNHIRFAFIAGENDEYWLREAQKAHNRFTALGIRSHLEVIPGRGHALNELIGDGIMNWFEKLR